MNKVFLLQTSALDEDKMFKKNFVLFETCLLNRDGLVFLEKHLDRLFFSIDRLKIKCPLTRDQISQILSALNSDFPARLRLNITPENIWYTTTPLTDYSSVQKLCFANRSLIDSKNPLFNHKTTYYDFIRLEKMNYPDFDDLILYNENNEITETTRANLFLVSKEEKIIFTPPLSSGVLPGIIRQELLTKNEYLLNETLFRIKEKIIYKSEINESSQLLVSNVLMGIKNAKII